MSKSIETYIEAIRQLPEVKHKGVSAIIGATVADAASCPLHWIYNQETLDSILHNANEPEFWPVSKSPYYTIPVGCCSSYNNAAYVTLASMNENGGTIDIKKICEKFKAHFGAGTAYEKAFNMRREAYDSGNRGEFPGPVEGPWIHQAVIKFLENYDQNEHGPYGDSDNKEMDGFCATLPVIAQNADQANLWNIVSEVSSLFTTNPETTKLFHTQTMLLSDFIQGVTDPIVGLKTKLSTMYPEVVDMLVEVEENSNKPYVPTIAKFGKACSLPGSFKGAYLTLLDCKSFVDAVRLNITAGGCTCSRGNVIGACLGAKDGIDGIPIDWLKKVKDIEIIMENGINVVSKRD